MKKLGGNFLARKTHKYAVFPLPWICTSNTSATIHSSYFPRDCLWQRRLILQPQYGDASDLHAGLAPLIYAQLECCFVGFSSFDVTVLASFWTAVNLIKSTTLLVWLFIAIARLSTSPSLGFGVMKRGLQQHPILVFLLFKQKNQESFSNGSCLGWLIWQNVRCQCMT